MFGTSETSTVFKAAIADTITTSSSWWLLIIRWGGLGDKLVVGIKGYLYICI